MRHITATIAAVGLSVVTEVIQTAQANTKA